MYITRVSRVYMYTLGWLWLASISTQRLNPSYVLRLWQRLGKNMAPDRTYTQWSGSVLVYKDRLIWQPNLLNMLQIELPLVRYFSLHVKANDNYSIKRFSQLESKSVQYRYYTQLLLGHSMQDGGHLKSIHLHTNKRSPSPWRKLTWTFKTGNNWLNMEVRHRLLLCDVIAFCKTYHLTKRSKTLIVQRNPEMRELCNSSRTH